MRRLLYLFILVLLSSVVLSQSGWVTQLGGVSSFDQYFRDIHFINSQTGWILQPREVIHTTDGGTVWNGYSFSYTYSYPYYYPRKIFFADDQTGWIAGGYIYRSTNSGRSWTKCDSNRESNSVYFINNQTGWACGGAGRFLKSTNSGLTWDYALTGISENLNSIYFLNDQTGFIGADWGKILKTTNAGSSWTVFYDNITFPFFQSVKFLNATTGVAAGSGGSIYCTYNAGNNWTKTFVNSYSNFVDVTFLGAQDWFVCGSKGDVYRSTNNGTSWIRTQSSGLYSNTYGIESAGSGNLWLIADSGVAFQSLNNAASWSEKLRYVLTFNYLLCIRFVNQQTGYSCGEYGLILKTTNSGTKWQLIRSDSSNHLTSIHFVNQSTGVAAGGNYMSRNIILRTSNGGANWMQVYSDTAGMINGVHFINANTGWSAGYKGLLLKTTNTGLIWLQLPVLPNSEDCMDVEFLNENTGFAVTANSVVLRTTNGGTNWIAVWGGGSFLRKIDFINESTGFVVGNPSLLMKTTNGGTIWSNINIGISFPTSVSFANVNQGWCSHYNRISFTSNSGLNWTVQFNNSQVWNRDIFFINENEGWACGSFGTIVHTSTGGIGINKISSEIPKGFKLYQNYPNPFNPVTKLRFQVPDLAKVKITVYDILGREIAALVNQQLQPGTYEVDFDGTNFASGVYFYNIRAGEFMHSRKMVLIK